MKKQFHAVVLTAQEYSRLLRQRGKKRMRQAYNRPCLPLYNYWFNWQCIRDEWPYLRCGRWQQESVRQAYRQRLKEMRAWRLLN